MVEVIGFLVYSFGGYTYGKGFHWDILRLHGVGLGFGVYSIRMGIHTQCSVHKQKLTAYSIEE